MQNMVKLLVAVAVLFLISCHNEVPSLPDFSAVKYCKYEKAGGEAACESTYVISEEDCMSEAVEGELVESCY